MYSQQPTIDIEVKKFDVRKIKFDPVSVQGPSIVLLGKRNSGKSFLIKNILYYHQDVPVGVVMAATENFSPFYSNFIPPVLIHYEYNQRHIVNVINRQSTRLKEIQKQIKEFGKTNIDPRTFTILDDCLYDKTWTRDKLMTYMFQNGRHLKTMLLITLQSPLGIPPELRNNIDYCFILCNIITKERRKIYENYASIFPTFEIFCQFMDRFTEDYGCLVIDNTIKTNKWWEQVFWYKAESVPENFKMCKNNTQLWQYKKPEQEDNYLQNIQQMNRRTKGPQVNINKLQ